MAGSSGEKFEPKLNDQQSRVVHMSKRASIQSPSHAQTETARVLEPFRILEF